MNKQDFMDFFRDDDKLNSLSTENRIEIFKTILSGSSDFTKQLLEEILIDYNVSNLIILNNEENNNS